MKHQGWVTKEVENVHTIYCVNAPFSQYCENIYIFFTYSIGTQLGSKSK